MPMKLMVRVRPGVELTWAIFCWSRELMRLDFPTLDRPRNANSAGPSLGNPSGLTAEVRNLAIMVGFIGPQLHLHGLVVPAVQTNRLSPIAGSAFLALESCRLPAQSQSRRL